MSVIDVVGKRVQLNEDGYLENFDDWDEDVGKAIAANDHLDLVDCHWEAIRFLRDYYREHGIPASARLMIKEVGHKLNQFRCTNRDLKRLFPRGGCKQACRIAGLPEYYCHAC
jgi:dissimilatory sulfite reductase related protein